MSMVKNYPAPPMRKREILRYAGAREVSPAEEKLMRECLEEISGKLSYRVCWQECAVTEGEGILDLGFMQTTSAGLRKNLAGCDRVILFAATIGLEIDRAIRKYSRISPAKALFFQAIGAERIEALCDAFCAEQEARWKAEGKGIRPRFSPGYGDLPLEVQRDFFRVLNCSAKIGVSLNESLLMSPSKSVTAIMGITGHICEKEEKGCSTCEKTDCIYRR